MSILEDTVKELIDQALDQVTKTHSRCGTDVPRRQYELAINALEEAQMRFTRGYAIQHDKFNPADLQKDSA